MPAAKKNKAVLSVRKIIPVFFLIIFFMPVSSTYFLFKIRQLSIHQTIRKLISRGIEEDKLVLLKIPSASEHQRAGFEQTEVDEFRYKGNMYDVVRAERHGAVTWYWCIWDEKETDLEHKLKELEDKAMGAQGDNEASEEMLTLFLNSLFFDADASGLHIPVKDLSGLIHLQHIYTISRTETPPTPPPKV